LPSRTWAGSTLSQRQEERRERLLDAGLELLGGADAATLGVRAVCRAAGLTERYFYESFPDRDALVAAVFERVVEAAHQALVGAVAESSAPWDAVVEAAVGAFVALILDDPRKGRVLLIAPLSEPALLDRGIARLPAFRALVREQLPSDVDELERQMIATGLVGALTQLFGSVLDGTLQAPRDRLVAHCVRLVLRAGHQR
jgi:AcrR family transcriptional regulator